MRVRPAVIYSFFEFYETENWFESYEKRRYKTWRDEKEIKEVKK